MAAERLLTPSKITAWLDCAHYLTLRNQVDDGVLRLDGFGVGEFARLVMAKGDEHERECLEHIRRTRPVYEVEPRGERERFGQWAARVGGLLAEDHEVLFQMPLAHDGIRGVADFLVKVDGPAGPVWEPVDAKLARAEARPGHVLQLCFYAEAIEAATRRRPDRMHLWLGSGELETIPTRDVDAYWRRLRRQLRLLVNTDRPEATKPVPCEHCDFCEFASVCDAEWRAADSLVYVAGLGAADRVVLEDAGIGTMTDLADSPQVDDVPADRLARWVGQAALQVEAGRLGPGEGPPFRAIEAGDDAWGAGLDLLPEPDDGDVFFDIEGHPFWTAARGLVFLFGIFAAEAGDWSYRTWWAHGETEERSCVAELIAWIDARRDRFPGMHVYHYNHTERSTLERLSAEYGVMTTVLDRLVSTGCFVDLYPVVRNSFQVGSESYGLKSLEPLAGYTRGHDIDQGAGAVVAYDRYIQDRSVQHLQAISAYNEDDVRATKALRDWLVEQRPTDLPWRPAQLEPDSDIPELDEIVERLLERGSGTPEHLLGEVLGYWQREYKANLAPLMAVLTGHGGSALDHPAVIAGLRAEHLVPRIGTGGKELMSAMRFSFPEQGTEISAHDQPRTMVALGPEGGPEYFSVVDLDFDARTLDLLWSADHQDSSWAPESVALWDWVSPKPKPEALNELATQVLDPSTYGTPPEVAMSLLRRDLPRFDASYPAIGAIPHDVEAMKEWVCHLDGSYVAVQGPPGTGKTWRAAQLAHALVMAGKRVGLTAMSHNAIDNLLGEVVDAFRATGDSEQLAAVRRGSKPSSGGLPGVKYVGGNKAAANEKYNLVAGTTWLFSGTDMAANPVDVLIIDEAGQLALADALAATRSAANLLAFGDPAQLPQVSQASHPGGGGASVLEHILGADRTIPRERGVFLTETRRLHPDLCSFVSSQTYDDRLHHHPNCGQQNTQLGTGLRWIPASHAACSTESAEEADAIHHQVTQLLGAEWTDFEGHQRTLTDADIMVVAAYNDQVRCVQERLGGDPRTAGVEVGTVDRFQGREAAVVFFTMASSSAEDIPRGVGFLFSPNRLNVAISRARCLAYLVCSEDLLDTRARTLEDMRLIATLCAFVEQARTT